MMIEPQPRESAIQTLIPAPGGAAQDGKPRAFRHPSDLTMTASTGDSLRVSLSGELDFSRCEEVASVLDEIYEPDIELDLSGLSFIDSSGLRVLILLQNRIHADGGKMAIEVGPSPIARTFEASGLTRVLPLVQRRSSDGATGSSSYLISE